MRPVSMLFAAALSCLAGVVANVPAQAAVFDFSFLPPPGFGSGSATGTFTTGAASPTDPGYDLLTSLTFNTLSGGPPPFSFPGLVTTSFAAGAAFNPTTDAFINHFGGNTFPNYGGTIFNLPGGVVLRIDGSSFSLNSGGLSGVLPSGPSFLIGGPPTITPIPEPSTWALALLGFAALGFLGYRQTRKGQAATA
jgi:hypothetical protein